MQLITDLTKIIDKYEDLRAKQLNDHPEYEVNNDVRVTLLNRLIAIIRGYQISIAAEQEILRPEWFHKSFNIEVTKGESIEKIDVYRQNSFNGFFWGLYDSIELSFKSISCYLTRTTKPQLIPFANIYTSVFNRLELMKYKDFFDILRVCRNSLQTGGIFRPADNLNLHITYKDRTFHFIRNQAVTHLHYTHTNSLPYFLDELLACISDIFNHSGVISIPLIEEKFTLS